MSNVPDEFSYIEELSVAEIEERIIKLRGKNPETLTDKELSEAVALHAVARRKTAGPPKGARKEPVKETSLADVAAVLGLPAKA